MTEPFSGMVDGEKIQVVVDVGASNSADAILMIENILSTDEGLPVTYHLHIEDDIRRPELDIAVRKFIWEKDTRPFKVTRFPTNFRFFLNSLYGSEQPGLPRDRRFRSREMWYKINIVLLEAISIFSEFVYLRPGVGIVESEWLSKLSTLAHKSNYPVCSNIRNIEIDGKTWPCGWDTVGWYKTEHLRDILFKNDGQEIIPNPWKKMGAVDNYASGEAYCLDDDWMSIAHTPSDFLFFAWYHLSMSEGSGPEAWSMSKDYPTCVTRIESEATYNKIVDNSTSRLPASMRNPLIFDWSSRHISKAYHLRSMYIRNAEKQVSTKTNNGLQNLDKLPLGKPADCCLIDQNERLSLASLRNQFKGKRCFILGNGPSLNNTDLNKLRYEYTFGLNRIYLKYNQMGFQTTFLCAVNQNVIEQFSTEIDILSSLKFLRYSSRNTIRNKWNVIFMESSGSCDFMTELDGFIWSEGNTVTYCAMQVAYFLGFDEVYLIGVDHNFPNSGNPHQLVESDGQDVNHFHPDYFGKGTKWQYPDLAGSETAYSKAKEVFETNGKKIMDATINGKLAVFPKVDYSTLF
jgi:hypothetical protein